MEKQKCYFKRDSKVYVENSIISREYLDKYGVEGFALSWLIYRLAECRGHCLLNNTLIKDYLRLENKSNKKVAELVNKIKEGGELFWIYQDNRPCYQITVKNPNFERFTRFEFKSMSLFSDLDFCSRWQLFFLFCVIESHHNEGLGYAFPSFNRLEKITGFSRPTISTYTSMLENLGLFDIKREQSGDIENPKNEVNKYFIDRDARKSVYSMSSDELNKLFRSIKDGSYIREYNPRKIENIINTGKLKELNKDYLEERQELREQGIDVSKNIKLPDPTEIPF